MTVIGTNRVLRGGSWNNNGRNARSANRNRNEPDNRNNNIGFRLALAHTGVDKLFDPTIIPSLVQRCKGKKQLPFGRLVGQWPDACRSGDLIGTVNVIR